MNLSASPLPSKSGGRGSIIPRASARARTLAQQERAEAPRKWLLFSAAIAAALVVGVLIGRFLLP